MGLLNEFVLELTADTPSLVDFIRKTRVEQRAQFLAWRDERKAELQEALANFDAATATKRQRIVDALAEASSVTL
jgi:hypothetical protein